ncbi:MAG TPA: IclR family transcriptional regulator C-terminal domain-containing protein [Microvirga sp.]|jgi:IclR family pca regulon transcriptional regulator|nr:IclR family transcriptional regulator C-terminal domain-containing protein [Microvirga sp.]
MDEQAQVDAGAALERPAEGEGPARTGEDREIVNSVLKAFDVLKAFSRHKPRMTLTEVAEYAGMSRASARRFLLTFVHAGYMETDGKRFQPTPKLLELSHAALSSLNIWDIARPILAELSDRFDEACYGAVLDGADVLYVLHIPSSARFVNVNLRVGSRSPAYCTSLGRVLLAGLPPDALERVLSDIKPVPLTAGTVTAKAKLREIIEQVRRQGWSLVDEELEVGLRSVSVPIRSPSGATVAAINMCGPTARVSSETLRSEILPELLRAADRINLALRD